MRISCGHGIYSFTFLRDYCPQTSSPLLSHIPLLKWLVKLPLICLAGRSTEIHCDVTARRSLVPANANLPRKRKIILIAYWRWHVRLETIVSEQWNETIFHSWIDDVKLSWHSRAPLWVNNASNKQTKCRSKPLMAFVSCTRPPLTTSNVDIEKSLDEWKDRWSHFWGCGSRELWWSS